MPWAAMTFLIWWLELACFQHWEAGMLSFILTLGVAAGNVLGGYIGDRLARFSPDHGRIYAAQFSVLSGIPLLYVIFFLLPTGEEGRSMGAFAVSLFVFGLCISWCSAAVNQPIMSEIVPTSHRAIIFSLDRSFEGGMSAIAPFVVGSLAVDVFGWDGTSAHQTCDDKDRDSLGKALFWTMSVTWAGCFFFYSTMHCTYPKDKRGEKHKAEGWAAIDLPDMSSAALWSPQSELKAGDLTRADFDNHRDEIGGNNNDDNDDNDDDDDDDDDDGIDEESYHRRIDRKVPHENSGVEIEIVEKS